MIRQLAILAVAAICLSALTPANAVAVGKKDVVKAQEMLYDFMLHVLEGKKFHNEILQNGREYNFESKMKTFDPEYKKIVGTFLECYKRGMLPRGRLFSPNYPYQMKETIELFRVLYYAPDIWEFLSISIWAYTHVNEYQFVYAMDTAIVHRADTKYFALRRPYEIFPEFFFTSNVMKEVYDIKMGLTSKPEGTETDTFTVMAKYSNSFPTDTIMNYEYNMTYFTEDISLNSWYFTMNRKFPYWMSSKEYTHLMTEKRGEMYYYMHRWILNRCRMERLSNGLGDIETLDWKDPIMIGYTPQMNYPNGVQFPRRKEWTKVPLHMNKFVNELMDYESRITAAVDSGFLMTVDGKLEDIRNEKGFNMLGNLIEGNFDSMNPKFYGTVDRLGKHVLGFSPKPYNHHLVIPSALDLTLTSMRDPAFYRLYKKIDHYFAKYMKHMGKYTHDELAFNGVKINSVRIAEKNIFTFFEWFDTVINRFWVSKYQHMAKIKVRQNRLNHKSFTYKMNINSDKDVKASIRIFMGPKFNIHGKEIFDNYKNFYEVDYFVKDLKKGDNVFDRKSSENEFMTSYDTTVDSFVTVTGDDQKIAFDKKRYGFPAHLLFPKGKVEGLPVHFFVYVSEFVADATPSQDTLLLLRDNKPLGFPMNRPMYKYTLPNMYFFDTKIVHKDETRINLTDQ